MRPRSKSVNPSSRPATLPGVAADGTTLLFDVWLVARATTDLLDRALAPSGLNADEFAMYSVLSAVDAMTPTELARWMAAPATTVSSHVKRFEARGHLERRRNPDDARSYILGLTAEGRRAHAHAARLFAPVLGEVVAALDRPEAETRASLLSIRRALDAVRDHGA